MEILLNEFSISFFLAMLFGVEIDAGGTEGKQALLVFAEIEDHLFGVEGAVLGFVG